MTKNEKELLDQLKGFFIKKYGVDGWETEFKKYTKKLVTDNHLDQEVIDEYLNVQEPDEIVKKFDKFLKDKPTRTFTSSTGSGCGSSHSSYSSGCGSSPRSYGSGCGGSGSYSRSSC